MKIAVIGCGFVGGTVANFLEEHNVDVVRVDPKIKGSPEVHELHDIDGAIIAINAPTQDDGWVDTSAIQKVINQLTESNLSIEIMVKSTMPMFSSFSNYKWHDCIVFNPEFLRQDTAAEDFATQDTFIIGVDPTIITSLTPASENSHAMFWTDVFAPLLPNTKFVYTDRETAAMVKYTHNAWLATKVAFFHEISIQMPGHSSYAEMTEILGNMANIGPSHMQTPNSDGQLGYGGTCFPKDVIAMSSFLQHNILDTVWHVNADLKKSREKIDSRYYISSKIPAGDYIVIIGTSHTYGQCNGKRINAFPHYLEQGLDNIKVVNIGKPGATNVDLADIVNQLNVNGWFGDRCKLVLLETRCTENTVAVSVDTLVDKDSFVKVIDGRYFNRRNESIINGTSMTVQRIDEETDSDIFAPSTADTYSHTYGAHDISKEYIKERALAAYNDSVEISGAAITSTHNWLAHELGYNANSLAASNQDLILIESMVNLIKGTGCNVHWFLVDKRDELLDEQRFLRGNTSDVFMDALLPHSVSKMLCAYHGTDTIYDQAIDTTITCDCGHLNEEGSIQAANLMLPYVKKALAHNGENKV